VKLAADKKKQVATEALNVSQVGRVKQIDAVFTKNDNHAMSANAGMNLMGFEIGGGDDEFEDRGDRGDRRGGRGGRGGGRGGARGGRDGAQTGQRNNRQGGNKGGKLNFASEPTL
jgi:hypothetical protein